MFASSSRRLGRATRLMSTYKNLLTEERGAVAIITLNRPKALNALTPELITELVHATSAYDANPAVGAMVITGSGEKAFAAGADIKTMKEKSYMEAAGYTAAYGTKMYGDFDQLAAVRKPIIAAVNGFALGGGCELAMICDFILASDKAVFGQPEIKLGTIPGLGGTQRFTRALGKSRAMEICLTGDNLSVQEACDRGLVSRIVPHAELLEDAVKTAAKIASYSQPVTAIAKTCVNAAFESSLAEGVKLERALFYSTFATRDQKIGMRAFAEKAKAEFVHE